MSVAVSRPRLDPHWAGKPPETFDQFALAVDGGEREMADLQRYYEHLVEWNARMNLVGPTALGAFWPRHVFDSAQLLHVEQSAIRWADVGAGSGFPGIVLAILLKNTPGACVHLIESMTKRVNFLTHVTADLALPAQVHHGRAEDIDVPAGLEVVTARACAPFPRLFEYTLPFFEKGARGLFLKGPDVAAELTASQAQWTFSHDLIPSLSDASGRLVRVDKLKRRG